MSDQKATLRRTYLTLALQKDEPPDKDTEIVYGVTREKDGTGKLHGPTCPNGHVNVLRRETTGPKLKEALENDLVLHICAKCYQGTYNYARQLAWGSLVKGGRPENLWWATSALLLYYEVYKPTTATAWVQWLYEQTPEELRAGMREELGWGAYDNHNVVYFEAGHGDRDHSWTVGAGEHIAVRRPGGAPGLAVHGLLPRQLAYALKSTTKGFIIDVGPDFGRSHLELAVNLYEEGTGLLERPGGLESYTLAVEAVRCAELVLA